MKISRSKIYSIRSSLVGVYEELSVEHDASFARERGYTSGTHEFGCAGCMALHALWAEVNRLGKLLGRYSYCYGFGPYKLNETPAKREKGEKE